MAAMAVNPRSQASTATGQCLQRYLAATMVDFCVLQLGMAAIATIVTAILRLLGMHSLPCLNSRIKGRAYM